MIDLSATDWMDDAACRGEDLVLFFGPEGEEKPDRLKREKKAKRICADCVVRRDCFEYGLHEKAGVWGGFNVDERDKVKRRRARRAAKIATGVA